MILAPRSIPGFLMPLINNQVPDVAVQFVNAANRSIVMSVDTTCPLPVPHYADAVSQLAANCVAPFDKPLTNSTWAQKNICSSHIALDCNWISSTTNSNITLVPGQNYTLAFVGTDVNETLVQCLQNAAPAIFKASCPDVQEYAPLPAPLKSAASKKITVAYGLLLVAAALVCA